MKIKNTILNILFPRYCLNCGKEGQYICKDCELFMNDINNFGNLIAFWEYNGIVKKAIHQIKYGKTYDIIKELVNKKDFEIKENTIITYVPMYIKKQKKRGFNQSEIIAKEVGKKAGLPVIKLLEKIRKTSDQARLTKEERLKNLQRSFCIRAKPGLAQSIQNILLVDDVYTTGATMLECTKVLKRAGFNNIQGFVLAKTT